MKKPPNMDKQRFWRLHDGALCLEGYSIRIVRPGFGGLPFGLEHDGRRMFSYNTLACAKLDGERQAGEIDEFEPVPVGE